MYREKEKVNVGTRFDRNFYMSMFNSDIGEDIPIEELWEYILVVVEIDAQPTYYSLTEA